MSDSQRLASTIGDELKGFGGVLQCLTCGKELPLDSPSDKLLNGWPKCHGYTMRWWTQRQVDAEEPLRKVAAAALDREGAQ